MYVLPEISDWQPEMTKREHARTDARMVFVFIPLSFAQRHLIVNMKIWGGRGAGRRGAMRGRGGAVPWHATGGGRPDAALCAGREPRQAMWAHGDAPCNTLSVCYLPSCAPRRGAAARWGHRALPQRDTSVRHGGGAHGEGQGEERDGARHGGREGHGVDTGVEHGAGVGSGVGSGAGASFAHLDRFC